MKIGFGGLNFGKKILIKSIQYGSITMNGTSTTANINSVDTSNSILLYLNRKSDSVIYTNVNNLMCRVELTNSTTVTGIRNSSSRTPIINFCVLEFHSGVLKSNQFGTITITGTSNTDTINSVNTTKSTCFFLGFTTILAWDDLMVADSVYATLELTNSTTVTGARASSTDSSTVGYQVVEFY